MQNQNVTTPECAPSPESRASTNGDQLFRAVLIESSDAMLVLNDSRRIVEANPAACLLFELTQGELTGRILDDLLADETGDLAGLWAVLPPIGVMKRLHGIAPMAQGRRVVECSYRALSDGDEWLCVVRETTDRRVLDARLAQSEKMDSLARLAGGIAHDFNNLLTAILGCAEMLLESCGPDAEERSQLTQIQQAGQHAAALTQQLLAYSRKQVLAPKQVDLNHTLTHLHATLTRLVGAEISVVCDPSPRPAFLRIDPTQLEHILVTLALNARDSIAAEGTIRIAVSHVPASEITFPAGLPPSVNLANPVNQVNSLNLVNPVREYIQLRVSDDGAGIAPAAHGHLFEPFFWTADTSRSTGLGLASVYGIIGQSQGFIEVESEIGGGTTFLMHFPAVNVVAAAEVPAPRVAPSTEGELPTILLVEDEDGVRAVASAMLRRHGYRVLEASTPRVACELFAQHADVVDLLLTDVMMPELNGPGLAQRLVALKPGLRVVFMSGHSDVELPFEGGTHIGFLSKPFHTAGLVGKVQAVLARPEEKS